MARPAAKYRYCGIGRGDNVLTTHAITEMDEIGDESRNVLAAVLPLVNEIDNTKYSL
jgi:hypothetical protein